MSSACFTFKKDNVCDRACPYYDKDYACFNQSNIYNKVMKYDYVLKYLKKQNIDYQDDWHGLLINDKFIFSPVSYKWCVKGKYKWYRSKGIEDFLLKVGLILTTQ